MGYIKFIGTAGSRFMMIRQLCATGGIWINYKQSNVLIDPGPGSLLRILKSRKPRLDPESLDGLILTHKHLDHSNDINLMIETMTRGGRVKRGRVFVPSDALGLNGVVYKYLQGFPQSLTLLKPAAYYTAKDIKFSSPLRLDHSVETYGLVFCLGRTKVGLISDTSYMSGLEKHFKCRVLIINVVLYERKKGVKHLSLDEAKRIISGVRPNTAILTHFGQGMLRKKPYLLEKSISQELEINVKCAYDGMSYEIYPQ